MATVTFHKPLSPQNLGVCLTELLKYVLYTNSQVPLPCDQLLKPAGPPEGCVSDCTRSGRPMGGLWRERRVREKTQKLRKVLSAVQCACSESGSEFLEAVIILGATIVSPKVLYRVVIDESLVRADAPPLAADNLRRHVVRSLVSNVLETCDTKISLTNCFVMLLAPRSIGNLGGEILPRATFKVVRRGSHVCLWFNSTDTANSTSGSRCREMVPQPTATKDTSSELKKARHKVQPPESLAKQEVEEDLELADLLRELQLTEVDSSHCRDDYIWFQISAPFHGFKELPATASTTTTTRSRPESKDSIWA